MRKSLRNLARVGYDSDVWPVVLVLFAVLIPAGCVLWFMTEAMGNERLAARQRLADAYRGQLTAAQARLEQGWKERSAELEKLARGVPAAAAFAKCVQSGLVDSAIIFDEAQHVVYPNKPMGLEIATSDLESKWQEAGQLEYLRKEFLRAAAVYHQLASGTTNIHLAARALQAEVRCLVRAGEKEAAVRLIDEVLAGERYRQAADPQGRLIVANAELLELELIASPTEPRFQSAAQRLRQRLMDYETPALPASQRRFLMDELGKLSGSSERPMLAAEEWAAEFLENAPVEMGDPALHRTPLPDLWQFTTTDSRVVALIGSRKLLAVMHSMAALDTLPADAEFNVIPPSAESDSAFVFVPAGALWPGWSLALSFKDQKRFVETTEHRTVVYLWTGLLMVSVMGVLTVLAVRFLRRQSALARMKNDLAATVSHELKTPLASMRVFVETLLDADKWDEQRVREYLQLIHQENERLSRLIHNFLAFSRMERSKHSFQLTSVHAAQVVRAAVEAQQERFEAPGCRLEVQIEDGLPEVLADSDAMATALINLLDNAWKYSEGDKQILLQARAEDGLVLFSVRDNGIGIAPRERRKIFRRFYQSDQRLSRRGSGCGLGLSIVEFIVAAHHGAVSVESEPGCGSVFTISIPAAPRPTQTRQEALA